MEESIGDQSGEAVGPNGPHGGREESVGPTGPHGADQPPPQRTQPTIKVTRRMLGPIHAAREEIEQTAITLTQRILAARKSTDGVADSVQDGAEAIDIISTEIGLLNGVQERFQAQLSHATGLIERLPDEQKDLAYDIIMNPIPRIAAQLGLFAPPTPTEMNRMAFEATDDLKAMIRAAERVSSRSSRLSRSEISGSVQQISREVKQEQHSPMPIGDIPNEGPLAPRGGVLREGPLAPREGIHPLNGQRSQYNHGRIIQEQPRMGGNQVRAPRSPVGALIELSDDSDGYVTPIHAQNPNPTQPVRQQGGIAESNLPRGHPAVRFLGNQGSRPGTRGSNHRSPFPSPSQRQIFGLPNPGTQPQSQFTHQPPPPLHPRPTQNLLGNLGPQWGPFWSGQRTRGPNHSQSMGQAGRSGPVGSDHSTTTFEAIRLQPPTFDGRPEEWLPFWTYFKRAVHDRHIPAYEKQLILLRCLKEGSPARKAVEVYAPADENYPVVLGILLDRFGDTEDLQRSLRSHLLRLPAARDSPSSLTTMTDEFERTLRQLEQLGANINDASFGPLLESKLPVQVLSQMRIQESMSGGKWTVPEFRQALLTLIRCRRSAETAVAALHPEREVAKEGKGATNLPKHKNREKQAGEQDFQRVFQTTVQQSNSDNKSNPGGLPEGTCSFCGGNDHRPSRCPTYNTAQKRRSRAVEQRRCFSCLAPGHRSDDCPKVKPCQWCRKNGHHPLLCNEGSKGHDGAGRGHRPLLGKEQSRGQAAPAGEGGDRKQGKSDSRPNPIGDTALFAGGTVTQNRESAAAYLMIGRVKVAMTEGGWTEAALIFDTGSQGDFVASSLVQRVKPELISTEELRVQTLGGHQTVTQAGRFRLRIQRMDGGCEEVEAAEIPRISSSLNLLEGPRAPSWHGNSGQPIHVIPELLLGIRRFWDFIRGFQRSESGTYLIDTIFGAINAGETFRITVPESRSLKSFMMTIPEEDEAKPLIPMTAVERFWSLETIGITDDPARNDDEDAIRQFRQSVRQLEDGRYSIRLPWRDPHPPLPSNFQIAYRRLASGLKRIQALPEVMAQVQKILSEQLELGIIEQASAGTGQREHFIPHQLVISPKKIRVVYDASAHLRNGPSLNDCLLRGPVLLPDLAGFLLRFRACRVPVVGDVQMAFLMVGIEPIDREVCKFLWVKDPQKPLTTDNLVVYRFRRLAFGLTSSPYCLAAVLRHHLGQYDGDLPHRLIENTYVDDVLLTAESEEEAIQMAHQSRQIFNEAKMNLRGFASANARVNEAVPREEGEVPKANKVLGIPWDTDDDHITIPFSQGPSGPCTRRSVLSIIASLFDPLGLVLPGLLRAKLFFQRLWDEEGGWDDPIEPKHRQEWLDIAQAWKDQELRVPRFVLDQGWSDLQLHVFTDASEVAFAAAVYVRSKGQCGIQSRLLFAKSRLKPKKAASTLTIPRMELLGILTGVRAIAFVQKELQHPVSATHLWSDSRIALAWIESKVPQPQFVQNRLAEIRKHQGLNFHFVRTHDNPADLGTRGADPMELRHNSLWWEGPPWLVLPEAEWPEEHTFRAPQTHSEQSGEPEATLLTSELQEPWPDLRRFGTKKRAVRVMAWVLRFIYRCKRKGRDDACTEARLTTEEILEAERALIRADQRQLIAHPQRITEVDGLGIIRLRSRIEQSEAPQETRQPIIFPKNSPLAMLFIRSIHEQLQHAGVDTVLTQFLQDYWMPGSRQTVRRVVKSCLQCQRMKAPAFELPPMPPLPPDRVRRHVPFQSVGVDFLGPTAALDDNGERKKAWVLLVTCLTTRAVYLEATREMSALAVAHVLRRFIARRGCPDSIISDNAPQFIVTGKAMAQFERGETDWHGVMAARGINWRCIPQHSPWAGGVYERLVQSCKRALQRTFGRDVPTYDALNTALAEAEAAINLRPLTYVSDEAGEFLPLRPVDFLQENTQIRARAGPLGPAAKREEPYQLLRRLWAESQERSEKFWQRWRSEYLLILREKAGWNHRKGRLLTKRAPKIGEVVLVEDKLRPRNLWAMGRIMAVHGHGQEIRSVQIRMANGRVWGRPVSKICPLEVSPMEPRAAHDETETVPLEEAVQPADEPSAPILSELIEPPGPERHRVTPPDTAEGNERQQTQWGQLTAQQDSVGPLAPTQDQLDGEGPTAPTPRWNLRPTTIAKTRKPWAMLAMMAWFFTTALAHPSPPETRNCALACQRRGITASIPSQIHKIEICCSDGCWATSPHESTLDYELPIELLLNPYNCTIHCWPTATTVTEMHIRCPARGECQLIDCSLCVAMLANPKCNPRLASSLLAFLITAFLIALGCCWSIFHRFRTGIWLISRFVALLAWGPIHLFNRITGRHIHKPSAEQIQAKAEKGVRQVRKSLRKAADRIRASRQRREYGWMALKTMVAIFMVEAALAPTEASAPISITSKTEMCRRGPAGLTCSISSATTLTLLPFGQTVQLLVKDEKENLLGALRVRMNALSLLCLPQTEAWYRSYRVETLAVKRCPRAGSCRGNFCAEVRSNTPVMELATLAHLPGHSACWDTHGFWSNGCGLPTPACLFYRWAARPSSPTVYESFSCPTWDMQLRAEVELEEASGKVTTGELILHPGIEKAWGNVSLSILAASLPPTPVLSSLFITDGRVVAIGPTRSDLHCQDRESATAFNCTLSPEACILCSPDHERGTVTCHCKDLDLEGRIEDPTARLPLTNAKMHLKNLGPAVRAEFSYAPVQLHLRLEGLELTTEVRDTKCWAEPLELSGCYRCRVGAQIRMLCRTDHGEALGSVQCDNGAFFALHCSQNGTEQSLSIPLDSALIDAHCVTTCPAGDTQFLLRGQLAYVPLREQFGYRQRTAATLEVAGGASWWPDLSIGPGILLSIIASPQTALLFIIILIIGLVVLWVVIQTNPVYRIYRLIFAVRGAPLAPLAIMMVPGTGATQESREAGESVPEFHSVSTIIRAEPLDYDSNFLADLQSSTWPEFLAFFWMSGLIFGLLIMLFIRVVQAGQLFWQIRRRRRQVQAAPPLQIRHAFYTIPLGLLLLSVPGTGAFGPLSDESVQHQSPYSKPEVFLGIVTLGAIMGILAWAMSQINRGGRRRPENAGRIGGPLLILFITMASALSPEIRPTVPENSDSASPVRLTNSHPLPYPLNNNFNKFLHPSLPRHQLLPPLLLLRCASPSHPHQSTPCQLVHYGGCKSAKFHSVWERTGGEQTKELKIGPDGENKIRKGEGQSRRCPRAEKRSDGGKLCRKSVQSGDGPGKGRTDRKGGDSIVLGTAHQQSDGRSFISPFHSSHPTIIILFRPRVSSPSLLHIFFSPLQILANSRAYYSSMSRPPSPFENGGFGQPRNSPPRPSRDARGPWPHGTQRRGSSPPTPNAVPGARSRPSSISSFFNGGFGSRSPMGQDPSPRAPRCSQSGPPYRNIGPFPMGNFRPAVRDGTPRVPGSNETGGSRGRSPIPLNRIGGMSGPMRRRASSADPWGPRPHGQEWPVTRRLQNATVVRGQKLDEYLQAIVGRRWAHDPWVRALTERHLRAKWREGWAIAHVRTGEIIPDTEVVIGILPASTQPIQPGVTVEQHHRRMGRPVVHPSWPCLYVPGGLVGTSKRSIKRQSRTRTGNPPWRFLEEHIDWVPFECTFWTRHDGDVYDGAPVPLNPPLTPPHNPLIPRPRGLWPLGPLTGANTVPLGERNRLGGIQGQMGLLTIRCNSPEVPRSASVLAPSDQIPSFPLSTIAESQSPLSSCPSSSMGSTRSKRSSKSHKSSSSRRKRRIANARDNAATFQLASALLEQGEAEGLRVDTADARERVWQELESREADLKKGWGHLNPFVQKELMAEYPVLGAVNLEIRERKGGEGPYGPSRERAVVLIPEEQGGSEGPIGPSQGEQMAPSVQIGQPEVEGEAAAAPPRLQSVVVRLDHTWQQLEQREPSPTQEEIDEAVMNLELVEDKAPDEDQPVERVVVIDESDEEYDTCSSGAASVTDGDEK